MTKRRCNLEEEEINRFPSSDYSFSPPPRHLQDKGIVDNIIKKRKGGAKKKLCRVVLTFFNEEGCCCDFKCYEEAIMSHATHKTR